jgi:hypothetical protein
MRPQHGGTPPHVARDLTKFLSENHEGRWVERCGPVTWPGQSPDLSQLDFFCWTTCSWKGIMMVKHMQGISHLQAINEVAICIRIELGHMQWHYSMGQQLDICKQSNVGVSNMGCNNLESCMLKNFKMVIIKVNRKEIFKVSVTTSYHVTQ